MKLWMDGGAPTVQVVLLIKWTLISGHRVKGDIEVYYRGNPNLIRNEVIFNLPDNKDFNLYI
jgi:hypothetical protein